MGLVVELCCVDARLKDGDEEGSAVLCGLYLYVHVGVNQ